MSLPRAALDGLRVLDAATLFAAPQLAALLGDLGADVVKVEPPGGDPLRAMGARSGDHSLLWARVARHKRSVTLDLGHEEGRDLLRRLVAAADVLVENLPAATLERWKLRYEDLRSVNPRLVMVSVSCYGRTGPYRDRPGNGTLVEAFGGLTHMTGEPDGPPLLTSLPVGDVLTAIWGALGALAACYQRDARGGGGQHVDVAMYEPILQLHGAALSEHAAAGSSPRRGGNRIPGQAPRNLYRTRDGHWLAVSAVTDRLVQRILELLGEDGPEARARFGSPTARREHADALDGLVARWIAGRDREPVQQALVAARIPVAPVNDLPALFADPHLRARGDLAPFTDPTPGPALGADNDAVYTEWAAATPTELRTLRAARII